MLRVYVVRRYTATTVVNTLGQPLRFIAKSHCDDGEGSDRWVPSQSSNKVLPALS